MFYPTEQEAEYPAGLVESYAQAAKKYIVEAGLFPEATDARRAWLTEELQKYHRMADISLRSRVVERLLESEKKLVAGQEDRGVRTPVAMRPLPRNRHSVDSGASP